MLGSGEVRGCATLMVTSEVTSEAKGWRGSVALGVIYA